MSTDVLTADTHLHRVMRRRGALQRWEQDHPGRCIYCHDWAYVRDHLIPRALVDGPNRSLVPTVPACHSCNTTLGASFDVRIGQRRKLIHQALSKRHRRMLAAPSWTADELAELEPSLRKDIEARQHQKRVLRQRLSYLRRGWST